MEVQDERPSIAYPLECVGFRGVRGRVRLRGLGGAALDASLDVCISVPGDRRGAHLSRNLAAVSEALESVSEGLSIEDYLERIAVRLLERHPYASSARVRARTSYYVRLELEEAGVQGEEPVEVDIEVYASRGGERRWRVSVTLYGMTACPSAQRTIAEMTGLPGPAPTHSQRAALTVTVEAPSGWMARIEDLAREAAAAFSAPAFSFLRRPQEARLVLHAHRNPRLAEDVAREALARVARLLAGKGFPPDTLVRVEVDSYESIHPHNVYVAASGDLASLLPGARTGISTRTIES